MIKRSESKSKTSRRRRSVNNKKRRLSMEGLEQRQLLAVLMEPPTQPATELPEYTINRNIGAVQSFLANESESLNQVGQNDLRSNADFLPLGTRSNQQDTIDVVGTLPVDLSVDNDSGFSSDIDTFAFDLRAGDILDIATQGAAGGITVRDAAGTMILNSDVLIGGRDAPLQSVGNATGTVVIHEDGRYFVTIAARPLDSTANYTLGLRTYRPTSESLAIGDTQILYLDFGGDVIDNNIFNDALIQADPGLPVGGVTRVRSLAQSLPILGLELGDTVSANRIIDHVVDSTVRIFEDLVRTGGNGDIESPNAQPGDYGIRILNSRDHEGTVTFDDPRVTRLLIGGTGLDLGLPAGTFGIAQSVDVGNFDLNELGVFALDGFSGAAQGALISPSASQVDYIGKFLGNVAAHEAGHVFGAIHTDNTNSILSVADAGGGVTFDYMQNLGPDGIFGTADDDRPVFADDFYMPGEVPDLNGFSIHFVTNALAHSLSSGTVGSTLSGKAFLDANADGSDRLDVGLAGVTVFADANGNGQLDPGESTALTGSDGRFSLSVGRTNLNVIALPPAGFVATTPTVRDAGSSLKFGFRSVSPTNTGSVFVDNNGNGFRDPGDDGLADVYVYLDLDGDDRPDLGEPGTKTKSDGTYELTFPGPGTYTIRDVVPPGFEQSFPASGEHTVIFTGAPLTQDYDFGLLPSQDFGDAPNSYGTDLASDGARHGITAGLSIGAVVDREIDGQPSSDSLGDDLDGSDDEDGVRLLSPLGPGADSSFEVTVNNTSGVPAFLQGFMDFNRDGDFDDLGEKLPEIRIPSGSVDAAIEVPVFVPATATAGATVARFRLSQSSGVGPRGFVSTGEVEDHAVAILSEAKIANNDAFTVSRNSLSNELDVLANDFQTPENQLTITSIDTNGVTGLVLSQDRKSIFYTPENGFVGRVTFGYAVQDEFGNTSNALVTVNVTFQSQVPIALDDSFEVPEGSVNRALNVLDNDIPSVFGGVTITSVTAGSAGGQLGIVGGGQSIRYTPQPGFDGTEQFTYSIQDSAGSTSTATVTIDLLPGSRTENVNDVADYDQIAFDVGLFDAVNINTPISSVQVGDEFLVRVTVEDRRAFANPEGVASAFLDLLYTDELVATVNSDNNPDFPFDISFGALFSGGGVLQRGDAQVPGLINEVGGVQRITDQQEHDGPVELFTLRMQAVSPGVAVFNGDPADEAVSETVLLGSDEALTPGQQRLGRTELLILPESDNFTSAIDDSFPDGRDSNGNLITAASLERHVLDVLANDNLGPTGEIREFGLVTNPTLGNVFIDDNGTPDNLNDDFLSYEPNLNANGLESFSYLILTEDGVRSTANVTLALGNQNALADVAYDFRLVEGDGSGGVLDPSSITIGDRIGVEVSATDLRFNPTFVFAGFLDVLYNSDVLQPSDTFTSDSFDFDVTFGPGYLNDPNVDSTASRPGIIDEFGTLYATVPSNPDGLNGAVLGTLFFDVIGNGRAKVVGSPADSSPFQDTLLFNEDDPVPVSDIRYDVLNFTVGPQQNGVLRQDVNNDGAVSPIDALLVINQIQRVTAEGEQLASDQSAYYPDVNGDTRVTALDALQVINFLKRESDSQSVESAEGEQLVVTSGSTPTDLASDSSDAVFAEISQDEKIVGDSQTTSESSTSGSSVIRDTSQDSEDEEDDVLKLLADDVSGIWS